MTLAQNNAAPYKKTITKGDDIINELADILPNEPILVIDANWQPLDITRRHRHAQKLMDTGKARLLSQVPYIIQLKYAVENPAEPHYLISEDPGRTNVGISLIDLNTGEVIMKIQGITRNKEVPKLMAKRGACRRTSRSGRRQVILRRVRENGTTTDKYERSEGRVMHHNGVEYTIPIREVRNKEARFDNRKREAGWLTPTATQLKRSLKNIIKRLAKFVSVADVCFEINKFAFMQLEDGSVRGVDYQNGRLKGFDSVEEYISNHQDGVCGMPGCQRSIAHYHHITPKHRGGSDRPENLVGLCQECHENVHLGRMTLPDEGEFKRFAGTSVLNQVIPSLCRELIDEWGADHVHFCSGYETKLARERLGLPKDHDFDAVAIAAACLGLEPMGAVEAPAYLMIQYRRQDRSLINNQRERTYKLDGKTVAKNRKPRFEQPKDVPALSEAGLTEEEISRLSVSTSRRSYNDPDRVMPGALYDVGGRLCILTGQQNNGAYLLFKYDLVDDDGKPIRVKASDAKLVCCNKGWVFVGRNC